MPSRRDTARPGRRYPRAGPVGEMSRSCVLELRSQSRRPMSFASPRSPRTSCRRRSWRPGVPAELAQRQRGPWRAWSSTRGCGPLHSPAAVGDHHQVRRGAGHRRRPVRRAVLYAAVLWDLGSSPSGSTPASPRSRSTPSPRRSAWATPRSSSWRSISISLFTFHHGFLRGGRVRHSRRAQKARSSSGPIVRYHFSGYSDMSISLGLKISCFAV